jgi:hypothetical protein
VTTPTPLHSNLLRCCLLGFYWRVSEDYKLSPPAPQVITSTNSSYEHLLALLMHQDHHPRVVLQILSSQLPVDALAALERKVALWANSSGDQAPPLPYPARGVFEENPTNPLPFFGDIRLCRSIFQRPRGNRSCFDKCK